MKEPYIRNMFIKNAAAFLLSIFVGVVAVVYFCGQTKRTSRSFLFWKVGSIKLNH